MLCYDSIIHHKENTMVQRKEKYKMNFNDLLILERATPGHTSKEPLQIQEVETRVQSLG